MLVYDVNNFPIHEVTFLFQDGVYLYIVEEETYDDFLNADDHAERKALAVVVLDLLNHRVIKSQIVV